MSQTIYIDLGAPTETNLALTRAMIAYADHHQLGWDIRMRRADEPIPSQAYCLVNHHERTPAADDSKTVALFGTAHRPPAGLCAH